MFFMLGEHWGSFFLLMLLLVLLLPYSVMCNTLPYANEQRTTTAITTHFLRTNMHSTWKRMWRWTWMWKKEQNSKKWFNLMISMLNIAIAIAKRLFSHPIEWSTNSSQWNTNIYCFSWNHQQHTSIANPLEIHFRVLSWMEQRFYIHSHPNTYEHEMHMRSGTLFYRLHCMRIGTISIILLFRWKYHRKSG